MKFCLISLENTLVSFGIRYISSALKKSHHQTSILFLLREHYDLEKSEELEMIFRHIKDLSPDAIGISVMSSHFPRAVNLTKKIKEKMDVPVIWGGIHVSGFPDECLQYADIACVNEGELPMVDLANALQANQDYKFIKNLNVKINGNIIHNPTRPRVENLDELPFPDYDLENQFVMIKGGILPLTNDVLRSLFPYTIGCHYVISSRGCPYSCTYCCNSFLRGLAEGKYLRMRSPENFTDEMKEIKDKFPFVETFVFMDDSFLSRSLDDLERFSQLYKEKVGYPFLIWASPLTIEEKKLETLIDAGLISVHLGLESGSDRVNSEIYHRPVKKDVFLRATRILEKYKKEIPDRRYDVITDNPWSNDEETLETLEVIANIPKPFYLGIARLMFYPKAALTERGYKENMAPERWNEIYEREFFQYAPTYLNRIMRVSPITPPFLIRYFMKGYKGSIRKILFYFYYYFIFGFYKKIFRPVKKLFYRAKIALFRKKLSPKEVSLLKINLVDFGL